MGKLPALLARFVLILALAPAAARAADAQQCGPFGDPPATVNRGWFGSPHRPFCIGGTRLGPWKDPGGDDRYACRYGPEASRDHQRPMIVFLHPSLFDADSLVVTGLIDASKTTDLGDGPGFVLLAPEGRNTSHHYPWPDSSGLGWDNWYRQFDAAGATVGGERYDENVDAAAIDHFIGEQAATGTIDTRRIYVMGWSNGAAMAVLYALNRPNIAAAAVYSAPDPFGAFDDPCQQSPVAGAPAGHGDVRVANPRAQIMHVRNACDIGGICPNGDRLAAQLKALDGGLSDVILDSDLKQVTKCDDSCGTDPDGGKIGFFSGFFGLMHHARWPRQWNSNVFKYLKDHPLAAPRPQF